MKLKSVRLRHFRLPLQAELRWGQGKSLSALDHLLVEVVIEGGHVGRGEAAIRPTIYGETLESVRSAISWLEPLLYEIDVEAPAEVRKTLDRLPFNFAAKAALEMALWDARAGATGTPLANMLPHDHERVRVSFIVGQGSVAETLSRAEFAYRRGVRVFKVKAGEDNATDEKRIKALASEFPDAEIYVDANETLNPKKALDTLVRWRELGVTMVEEPIAVQWVEERRRLRASGVLPLIADDSVFSLRDAERELELNTFDIINVKPARSGFCWSMGMLERSRVRGKGAMIGSQAMSSYGAARAALLAFHPAVTRPSELAFHLLAGRGFAEFPEIKDGWLYRDEVAAVEFEEKAFRAYEV
ncbi:enolase C-terminal domain-like protein [Oceanithermus sp.]